MPSSVYLRGQFLRNRLLHCLQRASWTICLVNIGDPDPQPYRQSQSLIAKPIHTHYARAKVKGGIIHGWSLCGAQNHRPSAEADLITRSPAEKPLEWKVHYKSSNTRRDNLIAIENLNLDTKNTKMGNNPPSVETELTVSDPNLYKEKRSDPVVRPRRTNSMRRSASLRKQKSRALRRNWPRCHRMKASHLTSLEQELSEAEDRRKLFQAAAKGDVEAVQLLVDSGVDANITDENQMTALHHAAMHARDGVIKALIERGADLNATDLKGGFSPLHWVVINADPQMGSTDHVDESIVALARGGCNMNCTDFNFATPLHIAAQKDNRVCIDTLIRLGADPDLVDITGRNCIKVARSAETKELIQKLHHMKEEAVYHVLEIPVAPSPPNSPLPPTPPKRNAHVYHVLQLSTPSTNVNFERPPYPPPPPPRKGRVYRVVEIPTSRPDLNFERPPAPLPPKNGHIYHVLEASPDPDTPPPTPPRRRKAHIQTRILE